MFRQDYIKRVIEQLRGFVEGLAGQVGAGEFEAAERRVAEAEVTLGLVPGADRLAPRSLAMMLGGGDKVVALALLLECRANIARARGLPAQPTLARALALLDCAHPDQLESEAMSLRARIAASRGGQ